ncbi:recombinase family protein [Lysinibacillus fusiformis]|uniref:recombinase family protein n=1 Tax=Lysinibacillus fusiformis TaxID=28031 RepID=UPI001E5438C5|nr:recombinase family protein [Lysinibacillus fusiformis]
MELLTLLLSESAARKMVDLMNIVELLNRKNIAFRSYTEKYETETPTGKLQFQMMAAIAE